MNSGYPVSVLLPFIVMLQFVCIFSKICHLKRIFFSALRKNLIDNQSRCSRYHYQQPLSDQQKNFVAFEVIAGGTRQYQSLNTDFFGLENIFDTNMQCLNQYSKITSIAHAYTPDTESIFKHLIHILFLKKSLPVHFEDQDFISSLFWDSFWAMGNWALWT